VISAAAQDIARCSASKDDLDVVLCFFLFQIMEEDTNIIK